MTASFGDVTGEYLVLRRECGLVADGHEVVWVTGADAAPFLQGILSQDVETMEAGAVTRSFLLQPQGKLTALLWVARVGGGYALVVDRGLGAVAAGTLSRYRIRVDAEVETDARSPLALWGPSTGEVLDAAGLADPPGAATDGDVLVMRIPLAGLDRVVVLGVDAAQLDARPAGALAATAVRVEAGEPVMGVDVDERTIPQETGLVPDAVSFTKGCYLGQELVARLDTRGHVNRRLAGIVGGSNVLPPPGAELVADDRSVGVLTSPSESLELRAPIGLSLVRREVADGDAVSIRWDGGSMTGHVARLPLDDFGS